MTTTQEAPTVAEMLQEKRAKTAKAPVYRELGVSSQTYDTWEGDVYIPGDEFVEVLADYFEISEQEMAWLLYRNRLRKTREKMAFRELLGLLTHPLPEAA